MTPTPAEIVVRMLNAERLRRGERYGSCSIRRIAKMSPISTPTVTWPVRGSYRGTTSHAFRCESRSPSVTPPTS